MLRVHRLDPNGSPSCQVSTVRSTSYDVGPASTRRSTRARTAASGQVMVKSADASARWANVPVATSTRPL